MHHKDLVVQIYFLDIHLQVKASILQCFLFRRVSSSRLISRILKFQKRKLFYFVNCFIPAHIQDYADADIFGQGPWLPCLENLPDKFVDWYRVSWSVNFFGNAKIAKTSPLTDISTSPKLSSAAQISTSFSVATGLPNLATTLNPPWPDIPKIRFVHFPREECCYSLLRTLKISAPHRKKIFALQMICSWPLIMGVGEIFQNALGDININVII